MVDMHEYGWAIGIGIIILAVSVGRALRGFGRALGDRSRQPPQAARGEATDAEVAALREDLEATRRQVAELAERLDFAERLLTKQRDADRLPPSPR